MYLLNKYFFNIIYLWCRATCSYLFNVIVIVKLEKLYQQQKPENKTTGIIKNCFCLFFISQLLHTIYSLNNNQIFKRISKNTFALGFHIILIIKKYYVTIIKIKNRIRGYFVCRVVWFLSLFYWLWSSLWY